MRTKYAIVLATLLTGSAAWAQETDDMYFNSKDRALLVQANEVTLARRYQQEDVNAALTNPVNPSDSYSGRGINPEYNAQAKNGTIVVSNNPDYFIPNYQPTSVNQGLNTASNYNNPYYNNNMMSNPYYGMGYSGFGNPYGMSPYSSFYSPYSSFYSPYSSFYSPYGMMSPYYGGMYSGMGMYPSMGMGFGSGFYTGIGYGMGSFYGPSSSFYGMGMGSFYNPYYYGGIYGTAYTMDRTNVTYGRHPSRSNGLNNYVDNTRSDGSIAGTNGRVRDNGRSRAETTPNYYDRGWRDNSDNFSRSNMGGGNTNTDTRGGWSSGTSRGGWNNGSGWENGGNSRSSAFDSFGGGNSGGGNIGGRSSGFGGGGGSSGGSSGGGGGHSRGRN